MIKKMSDYEVYSTKTERWYYTNEAGNGLWVGKNGPSGYESRQMLGTCDFTTRGVKDPVGKLRRYVKAYEAEIPEIKYPGVEEAERERKKSHLMVDDDDAPDILTGPNGICPNYDAFPGWSAEEVLIWCNMD